MKKQNKKEVIKDNYTRDERVYLDRLKSDRDYPETEIMIDLTKDNAGNLHRYCYMIGDQNHNKNILLILNDYLENRLKPEDKKKINKRLEDKDMKKLEDRRATNNFEKPVWDPTKNVMSISEINEEGNKATIKQLKQNKTEEPIIKPLR